MLVNPGINNDDYMVHVLVIIVPDVTYFFLKIFSSFLSSCVNAHQIQSVEQSTGASGEVQADICLYEIMRNKVCTSVTLSEVFDVSQD